MKPRTMSDWTVGAKLNDEHVSEQEAERIAEVKALREEVEKLRAMVSKFNDMSGRQFAFRRLLAACQSLHKRWKQERELVYEYQTALVTMGGEYEATKAQVSRAEARIAELEQ